MNQTIPSREQKAKQEKLYICPECRASFALPGALRLHMEEKEGVLKSNLTLAEWFQAMQIEGITYWPQTTIPYGEDTAFKAAQVYAQGLNLYQDKDALIRRAAELLRGAQGEEGEVEWDKMVDQWLRDAGVGK